MPIDHFCHVILTFPSTVSRKLLRTELVDSKAVPLPQLHYNTNSLDFLFHGQPLPDTFSSIPGNHLMIYLPFEQVSCWLGGATSGKQHCTVLQNLPCSGAGNSRHCLEPSSSHSNAETSGSS